MFTIYDYINYYGKKTIDEIKWNIMDNLICSILVYLPINGFNENKTIKELAKYAEITIQTTSFVAPDALEILKNIKNAKRYENLIMCKYKKIVDTNIQFGAAIFRIKKKTIVSFEGTDGSSIGWIENFRLCYNYPTKTQNEAIKYLKENISIFDTNIDIVGHSKGGNMAMVSAMETSDKIFKKINKIYNFDGPGFRDEEFNSEKFKKMQEKLVNIVPTESVVGILFNNTKCHIVKSTEKAFYAHNPVTWNTYGEFFVEDELSTISKKLQKIVIKSVREIDSKMLEETVETLVKNMEKNYKEKFTINFNDLKKLISNRNNINPEITKYFIQIINILMEAFATKE